MLQAVQGSHEHIVVNGSMYYSDGDLWDDYELGLLRLQYYP